MAKVAPLCFVLIFLISGFFKVSPKSKEFDNLIQGFVQKYKRFYDNMESKLSIKIPTQVGPEFVQNNAVTIIRIVGIIELLGVIVVLMRERLWRPFVTFVFFILTLHLIMSAILYHCPWNFQKETYWWDVLQNIGLMGTLFMLYPEDNSNQEWDKFELVEEEKVESHKHGRKGKKRKPKKKGKK